MSKKLLLRVIICLAISVFISSCGKTEKKVTSVVDISEKRQDFNVKLFKDIFGNWQDYGSSKEGLDEDLRRDVFEIQHDRAWSHMNWDLDSPPGPW